MPASNSARLCCFRLRLIHQQLLRLSRRRQSGPALPRALGAFCSAPVPSRCRAYRRGSGMAVSKLHCQCTALSRSWKSACTRWVRAPTPALLLTVFFRHRRHRNSLLLFSIDKYLLLLFIINKYLRNCSLPATQGRAPACRGSNLPLQ